MDNRVYVSPCADYEQAAVDAAVAKAVDALGGISAIAESGQKVLLKPNLLLPRKPEAATTTHPAVVIALAKLFIAHGCTVEIADSCGGPSGTALNRTLYKATGMSDAAQKTGAVLRYDTGYSERTYTGGKTPRVFPLLQAVCDADVIVTVAKMKTHGLGHYTGAVKNMYGALPGLIKPKGHGQYPKREDFFAMVVDLYECTKPVFSVVDGIVGMEGDGPNAGTPKAAGVILAGFNGHSVDRAAVEIMGLQAKNVYTLVEAKNRGLRPSLTDIEILGADLNDCRVDFRLPAEGNGASFLFRIANFLLRGKGISKRRPWPVILTDKCNGCGKCKETCPETLAITIAHGKAAVNRDDCIRCYCCHELCPVHAIALKNR
jgi:uncharacterized protein (DUF362 family)/NAD-dependent dihydropyrimidine dehydrogenase PreA subunit